MTTEPDSAARAPEIGMAIAVMAVVGLALRLGAAGGDLWLDEIWSLDNLAIARAEGGADVWLALFTYGNTHPLNSLFMLALGPDAPAMAYRGLSIVSGTAAIVVAAAIGRRRGPAEAAMAALLMALSYAMVHYAGEARGYAPMMLAALAAFYVFERWLDGGGPGSAIAFVAVSLLAFFAHATFVIALAGFAAWAAVATWNRRRSLVSLAARLATLFGIQAAVITGYAILLSKQIGTGPQPPVALSVLGMMAPTFGIAPDMAPDMVPDMVIGSAELTAATMPAALALLATAAVAAALIAVVVQLYRRGDGSWPFFALVAVAIPAAVAVADPPVSTVPRYFFIVAVFQLLLAARALAMPWCAGGHGTARRGRIAAGALLALFVAGNAHLLVSFYADGRGHYADAVRFIATKTADGAPARVAGYQAHRIGTVLAYHARRAGLTEKVRFAGADEDAARAADWFIAGFAGTAAEAPPETLIRAGPGGPLDYRLAATFRQWGPSGETWAVYRLGE